MKRMSEMSKSEVLYVKGMKMSESDGDDDDIWDDSKLNAAYDKALRMTTAAEVAQRVAMATNSHHKDARKPKQQKPVSSDKHSKKTHWKPRMSCRTVYEGDGLEYEAVILRLINEQECVVKFLGYDNSEIVAIDSLQPSLGKDAQEMQIVQANFEKDDELATDNSEKMDISDRAISPVSTDRSHERQKKTQKRKTTKILGFNLPDVPMPNTILQSLGGISEMPVPPPPPLTFPNGRMDSEEQAISSMLMSWYMSGYYAGLYQGLKRSKESHKSSRR